MRPIADATWREASRDRRLWEALRYVVWHMTRTFFYVVGVLHVAQWLLT